METNNIKFHSEVYKTLLVIKEAEEILLQTLNNMNVTQLSEITVMLSEALMTLNEKLLQYEGEDKRNENDFSSYPFITSIIYSFKNILHYIPNRINTAKEKTEFELIPLTEYFTAVYYARNIVIDENNASKKPYKETLDFLIRNKYIEESVKTGNWKYDLSITVLAYNKLEYTKSCIAALMKHYPRHIRTELILVNHGSTDGTKDFFESVCPDKQLDIKINGGGCFAIGKIIQGKYRLSISNDVFVQKNSIANLYECITSADDIAYVVPSTSNVSNYQALPCTYSDEKELENFVYSNNISDEFRWEQRTRLCNPIGIYNSALYYKPTNISYLFNKNIHSFPDDALSLICRRNGYKMYLAKDAYCHHCGSVTLKEDASTNSAEAFAYGRMIFKQRFGIDPWFKSAYSRNLFELLKIDKESFVRILAINGGTGGNGLKIKESLKEKVHNLNVYLKYILTDKLYYDDVKFLGDDIKLIDEYSEIASETEKYDYIIAEDIKLDKDRYPALLDMFYNICNDNAVLIIEIKENDLEYFELLQLKKNYTKTFVRNEQDNNYFMILK